MWLCRSSIQFSWVASCIRQAEVAKNLANGKIVSLACSVVLTWFTSIEWTTNSTHAQAMLQFESIWKNHLFDKVFVFRYTWVCVYVHDEQTKCQTHIRNLNVIFSLDINTKEIYCVYWVVNQQTFETVQLNRITMTAIHSMSITPDKWSLSHRLTSILLTAATHHSIPLLYLPIYAHNYICTRLATLICVVSFDKFKFPILNFTQFFAAV